MKQIILIFFLFFVNFDLSSQVDTNFCLTKSNSSSNSTPWIGNNDFLLDYLQKYPLLDSSYIYYRIPICFHIYNTSPSAIKNFYSDVKKIIKRINTIYSNNHTGIFFYISDIIFIDKASHLVVSYYTEAPIISSLNKNIYSINIYYVDVLQINTFGVKKYNQGVYNSLTKSITIIKRSSQTTLAHEIGHFLGLKHPHRNWNKSKRKQESVSRTRKMSFFSNKLNCEVNGDGLSDTPAEPNLSNFSDADCNYIGDTEDNWGDKYCPNVNNIMSYPINRTCRTNFTTMQKAVMLYTADNYDVSYIWKNCKNNIHFSADNFEPDDNIYQLTPLTSDNQYHTFHLVPSKISGQYIANKQDWFSIDSGSYNKLVISCGKNIFPTMKLYLFSEKLDTLFSVKIERDTMIGLNYNDLRIIKIENLSPPETEILYDYIIKLK